MKYTLKQAAKDMVDTLVYISAGVLTVIAVQQFDIRTKLDKIGNKIVNLHHYKATFEDALRIHAKMRKHTGVPNDIPLLKLDKTKQINAYVSLKEMRVTQGLLNHVTSENQLAHVIAHEMGHVMLYHLQGTPLLSDSRVHEANADKISVYLLMRTGYSVCGLDDLWLRWVEKQGATATSGTHPNKLYRAYQLTFPHCKTNKGE